MARRIKDPWIFHLRPITKFSSPPSPGYRCLSSQAWMERCSRAPPLWRQAERLGVVGPREEKAALGPLSSLPIFERGYRADGVGLVVGNCSDRTRNMGSDWKKGKLGWIYRRTLLWRWWGTAKDCSENPIPGCVQGQVGQSLEQPGLVGGFSAHDRGGLVLDNLKGLFQPKPFYDVVILSGYFWINI